jgi:PilZ domain
LLVNFSVPSGTQNGRGPTRHKFTAEVGIRRAGVRSYRVRVFDASREGCKIEFIERPAIGEVVWIKFDGIEALESTVRWVAGHIGGVRFTRPLHEAVFQRLANASKADPE